MTGQFVSMKSVTTAHTDRWLSSTCGARVGARGGVGGLGGGLSVDSQSRRLN